jgi:hypothetical protein
VVLILTAAQKSCLSRTLDFALFYVIGQKYGIKIQQPVFLDRTGLIVQWSNILFDSAFLLSSFLISTLIVSFDITAAEKLYTKVT